MISLPLSDENFRLPHRLSVKQGLPDQHALITQCALFSQQCDANRFWIRCKSAVPHFLLMICADSSSKVLAAPRVTIFFLHFPARPSGAGLVNGCAKIGREHGIQKSAGALAGLVVTWLSGHSLVSLDCASGSREPIRKVNPIVKRYNESRTPALGSILAAGHPKTPFHICCLRLLSLQLFQSRFNQLTAGSGKLFSARSAEDRVRK